MVLLGFQMQKFKITFSIDFLLAYWTLKSQLYLRGLFAKNINFYLNSTGFVSIHFRGDFYGKIEVDWIHKTKTCLEALCYYRLWTLFYPPGSKSEALQLGVHFILLYFISIWSWVRKLFFFDGWWVTTFWFLKSLDINMVYTLNVYVYI